MKVKSLITKIICGILLLGLLTVFFTMGCYGLKIKGRSNAVADYMTRNAEVNLSWTQDIKGNYLKFQNKKNLLERYKGIAAGITSTVETFCTGALPVTDQCKDITDAYKTVLLHNAERNGAIDGEALDYAVSHAEDFKSYLSERAISYGYIHLPRAERVEALRNKDAFPEYLKLQDDFANAMSQTDIEFMNVDSDVDLITGFSMDLSNHWYGEDALDTLVRVLPEINEKYGYSFSTDKYQRVMYEDYMTAFEEFNGSIFDKCGYTYSMAAPIEKGCYEYKFEENPMVEGSFDDVFFSDTARWNSGRAAYHGVYTIGRSSYSEIVNTGVTSNPDKRLLVIGDSFSWPMVTYMAQDVENIAYINPTYFQGNIKNYIEYYKPDLVLMIYAEIAVGDEGAVKFGCLE